MPSMNVTIYLVGGQTIQFEATDMQVWTNDEDGSVASYSFTPVQIHRFLYFKPRDISSIIAIDIDEEPDF